MNVCLECFVRSIHDIHYGELTTIFTLMRSGLLEVRTGEDGRTRLVRITPAGERSVEGAYPLWQQAQYGTVSALGEERYEALLGDVAKSVSLAAKGSREARSGTA